jgi:hypothetical protein
MLLLLLLQNFAAPTVSGEKHLGYVTLDEPEVRHAV